MMSDDKKGAVGTPKKQNQSQGQPLSGEELEICYAFTEFEKAVIQILSLFAC
jgi:hypothetical protein